MGFASPPHRQQVPRVGKISEGLLRAPQTMPEDVQLSGERWDTGAEMGRTTPGPGETRVRFLSLPDGTIKAVSPGRHSLYEWSFVLVRKQSKQPFPVAQ